MIKEVVAGIYMKLNQRHGCGSLWWICRTRSSMVEIWRNV